MVNILITIIERNASFNDDHELDYEQPFYSLSTNMHELSSSMGWKELNVDGISRILDSLQKNIAQMYYRADKQRIIEKSSIIQYF